MLGTRETSCGCSVDLWHMEHTPVLQFPAGERHFVTVPKEKLLPVKSPALPPSRVMHALPLKMMMNYSPFIVLECAHGDQSLVQNIQSFSPWSGLS